MAAMDRRNPGLDDFVGLNWSCWVERVNILTSDAEDSSKCGRNCSETMTLRKEDMPIYGDCPAHDEIYLVVCNHCGQVIKPQAFEKHCERRHGPLMKMCQSSSVARQHQHLSNLSSCKQRQKNGRCHEANLSPSSSSLLPIHQRGPTKALKEKVSFPSTSSFPQQIASSMSHHRVPPLLSAPQPPGRCSPYSSLSEKSVHKPPAGQSSDCHTPLRGTRTYTRIFKKTDKKECDLNKHCRVLDLERKKLCHQELQYAICNAAPILQQKATGGTKICDQLAVEQRRASVGYKMARNLGKSKDRHQHLEAFDEKTATQGSRQTTNSSSHMFRPKDPSKSFSEDEGDSTVEVEVQTPYPFNQNLLLSEESEDDDNKEEDADLPVASWHPKPLGLCTFGCRTMGCSIFTFDRRWQHLRFALSAMLEQHVNTHL